VILSKKIYLVVCVLFITDFIYSLFDKRKTHILFF